MGTYTDREQVKSLFRKIEIEDTDTVITNAELDQFIDDAEIEVTARISKCYDTTLLTANDIKLLALPSKYKAAQTVKNVLDMTQKVDPDDKKSIDSWEMRANAMLNKICPKNYCGDCKDKPSMPLEAPMIGISPDGDSQSYSEEVGPYTFSETEPNW